MLQFVTSSASKTTGDTEYIKGNIVILLVLYARSQLFMDTIHGRRIYPVLRVQQCRANWGAGVTPAVSWW